MPDQSPLRKFLTDQWPSISLTTVAVVGMAAVTTVVLTGHADQAGPIIVFLTTLIGLLAVIFKINTAQADAKADATKAADTAQQAADTAQKTKDVLLAADITKMRALTAVAQVTAQSTAKVDQALAAVSAQGAKIDKLVDRKEGDTGVT